MITDSTLYENKGVAICLHIAYQNLGRVTDVQICNGRVVWNPSDETGGEITGYDVRFRFGGRVIYLQGVTEQWYTQPESVQHAKNCQVHCW